MAKDLRFALRMLLRSPGFTFVAVTTLALGIGANTAIFSLINAIFLHGLPFSHSARLVRIFGEAPDRNLSQLNLSITKFEHFRDRQTSFVGVGADFFTNFTLTGHGDPVQLNGIQASSNYFDLLGVTPTIGRLFRPEEDSTGEHVALLSQECWASRFDRDPAIQGKVVTLNGVPHIVIGVLPPQPPAYFGNTDVWTTRPEEFPGITPELRARGFSFLRVIALPKPGVSIDAATKEMTALMDGYRRENGEKADSTWNAVTVPLEENTLGGGLQSTLWLLFGAVGFVLLIATSNVANLLLVRFVARRREIAVRLAMGADRSRVVRLFMFESVIVAGLAAVAGTVLATLGIRLLIALNPPLPLGPTVEMSGLVLAFAAGVAVLTGLLMGWYPAIQAARSDVVDALKEGGRGNTASRGQHWFRMSLLGGQVTLSCVLLVGAFLLVASMIKLQRQEPGFNPSSVFVAGLTLPPSRYPDKPVQAVLTDRLLESVRHTPGVRDAAIGVGLPLTGFQIQGPYSRADSQFIPYTKRPLGPMRFISTDYFATLGIPILEGREFDDHDRIDSPMVTIISRSTAKRLFPEGGALGRHLLVGSTNQGQDAEIVGIAGDIRSLSLTRITPVEIYRPLPQRPGNSGFFQLAVRTAAGEPTAVANTVRQTLRAIDPDLPLVQPTDLDTIVAASIGQQRLMMSLLGLFAALALALAVVGIYSVVAYLVGQRETEIGVRLALGAVPRDVIGLMVRQGMTPVVIGLVAGIAAAIGLGRLLQNQLFGTTPFDAPSFVVTTASILIASLVACWLPSWRAARVGPARALRT